MKEKRFDLKVNLEFGVSVEATSKEEAIIIVKEMFAKENKIKLHDEEIRILKEE